MSALTHRPPTQRSAATSQRAPGPADVFDPIPDSLPSRIGDRVRHHPVRVDTLVCGIGYVTMAVVLIGFGLLLTQVLLPAGVERWDVSIVRNLVAARTPTLDRWTHYGSYLGETGTVIGIAAVATIFMAIRRAWAQIGFLVGGLVTEVTSFVTTTFVVDRNRPPVPKLDAAPPTSSFPSGHVAASIVLYVGLAVIISSSTRSVVVRTAVWLVALLLPVVVAVSRMQRGMHHPTDIMGSVVGATGCLLFSLWGVRAARASAKTDNEVTT